MPSSCLRKQVLLQSLLLLINSFATHALFIDYPSANISSSWLNNPLTIQRNWRFSDNTSVRTVLAIANNGSPNFCFGFFNNGTADAFVLAILKLPNKVDSTFTAYDYPPVVLWTANGGSPVQENATLVFTDAGLFLQDEMGTTVWSRGSHGSVSMELAYNGNLRLVGKRNDTIWESFQEPTDTWLPGQTLFPNQYLHSSISTYNLARGLFYLGLDNDSIGCYVDSKPAHKYCSLFNVDYHTSFDFGEGWLNRTATSSVTYNARSRDFQYLRLQPNGGLSVFLFVDNYKETFYYDLLNDQLRDACAYPTVCGQYGVCENTSCSCTKFFRQLNDSQAESGCQPVNPISCEDKDNQSFLELRNVSYFSFSHVVSSVDAPKCKVRCLRDCSCKAVLFRYRDDISKGDCSFPADLYSLKVVKNEDMLPYTAFITYVKIQNPKGNHKKLSSVSLLVLLFSLLASGIFLFILGTCCFRVVRRKKHAVVTQREEEISIIHIPPVVKKFSYNDLRAIADDFKVQLGTGGYGEVFEGKLENGKKVAVKQMFDKGNTEFLPEVETIGRVHHFNLVKLVGYCAEGSNRLLVYEYLHNGSLDKWIFNRNKLTWEIKWRIILGIAKGLEYLHEHCNPKIIHFDIKPQNILLDEEFNVKIADFGLAKWIERDQSKVSTMVKGTRGYMAPEVIAGGHVSVKVDVYSFGMVILEIVCGRKNSDFYREDEYLIDEVKWKAEEGRLEDLIDECNEEFKGCRELAVMALEIGIRCLQPRNVRPSMAVVVKYLEGMIDLEPISDYGFLSVFCDPDSVKVVNCSASKHLVESVLSGQDDDFFVNSLGKNWLECIADVEWGFKLHCIRVCL